MTRLADAYDAAAEALAALAIEIRATERLGDAPGATLTNDPAVTTAPTFDELPFEDEPEFEDTPAGRSKAGGCLIHGVPWRVVPAGVSKATGKPYRAFWACQERDCPERPTLAWVKAHPAR